MKRGLIVMIVSLVLISTGVGLFVYGDKAELSAVRAAVTAGFTAFSIVGGVCGAVSGLIVWTDDAYKRRQENETET